MLMAFPREILNKLKWEEDSDLSEAEITYVHRGAPGDRITIGGDEIVELERSFFVTQEAKIPYHRITEIRYRGHVLYEVEKKE